MEFLDVNFGYASAEREGANAPDLLLSGYLDQRDLTKEALYGTGSCSWDTRALANHRSARARLFAAGDPMLFVTHNVLDDFPYDTVRDGIAEGGDGGAALGEQGAWSWLLLLQLLDSLG